MALRSFDGPLEGGDLRGRYVMPIQKEGFMKLVLQLRKCKGVMKECLCCWTVVHWEQRKGVEGKI